jgi:creatinine amidohydrolase
MTKQLDNPRRSNAMIWGNLTAPQLAAAARHDALVILPLGCTEQHGQHLPVDTDTYQAERLVRDGCARAAERFGTRTVVLPTLPFGPTGEHFGSPGTLHVDTETYVVLVKQLLRSVVRSGFKRIVVVRGCGGHWAVPSAAWDIKAELEEHHVDVTLRVLSVSKDWSAAIQEHFPGAGGGHAGVMETALALAEREHLVDRDAIAAPVLKEFEERYHDGGEVFLFSEISSTGALSDPTAATVEGGRNLWRDIIERFADQLGRIEAQDRRLLRLADSPVEATAGAPA